jgi:hypothetical protein
MIVVTPATPKQSRQQLSPRGRDASTMTDPLMTASDAQVSRHVNLSAAAAEAAWGNPALLGPLRARSPATIGSALLSSGDEQPSNTAVGGASDHSPSESEAAGTAAPGRYWRIACPHCQQRVRVRKPGRDAEIMRLQAQIELLQRESAAAVARFSAAAAAAYPLASAPARSPLREPAVAAAAEAVPVVVALPEVRAAGTAVARGRLLLAHVERMQADAAAAIELSRTRAPPAAAAAAAVPVDALPRGESMVSQVSLVSALSGTDDLLSDERLRTLRVSQDAFSALLALRVRALSLSLLVVLSCHVCDPVGWLWSDYGGCAGGVRQATAAH